MSERQNKWELSNRVNKLETYKELQESRLSLLERSFETHMLKEERKLESITSILEKNNREHMKHTKANTEAISDIQKVVYRIVWTAGGVTGTLLLLWIIGKEVVKYLST